MDDETQKNDSETVSDETTSTEISANGSSESEVDKLYRTVKELQTTIEKGGKKTRPEGQRSEDKEKISRLNDEVMRLKNSVDTINSQRARRGEFEVGDMDRNTYDASTLKHLVLSKAARGSDVDQIQQANDDLYLGTQLLQIKDPRHSPALMQHVKCEYPTMYKAMESGNAGTGGDWVPTGFSNRLVELVQLELRVAALHERFNMPTDPFIFPVEYTDSVAYTVAENTTDEAYDTASNRVTPSTPGTQKLTFDAKKVGSRIVVSTEITEDSIIPILPYIRMKIVRAMATAQENTVINGSVSDLVDSFGALPGASAKDQRKTYDGYRAFITAATGLTTDLGTFSVANIRKLRAAMGIYGVDTSQLVFLTGINVYNQLVGLTEVTTIDKFGSQATILRGQLAALDGIPIVVSEYVGENLNAVGLSAGHTGNAKTELLLVRKDSWRFGDRREITIKGREIIETDQQVLVALQRLDFKPLHSASSGHKLVSAGVNITKI